MKKRLLAILMVAALLIGLLGCQKGKTKYTEYSFDFFDTATTVVGYEETKEQFDRTYGTIKALLEEYHQLYDIYHRYDGVINLCSVNDVTDGVHHPQTVDSKILDLLFYAKDLCEKTGGKMNVAMGSVLSIWHDYRTDGISHPESASLPPMDKLKEAAEHTDISKMILNREDSTVFLSDPKMKLDVGAIAKGYAVERIAEELERLGVCGYILNVGGNIRCVGARGDGSPWSVAIENPDTENQEKPFISYLHLTDQSLVTSGSYQRFYTVDGVRYHHIIDPATLMPAAYFRSVSVLCPHSGQADALSTALFSMPYEEGCALIESIPEAEALWVMADGEQKYSSGFLQYTYKQE